MAAGVRLDRCPRRATATYDVTGPEALTLSDLAQVLPHDQPAADLEPPQRGRQQDGLADLV
jgi:hypothetical protein